MMDTYFIAICKHLVRVEEVFFGRFLTIERKFMNSLTELQAAVQASNDAIATLSVSVDKLIGLASGNAASLAAAVQAAAAAGAPVNDDAINKAIESLRAGASAAAAESQKANAAIAADSVAPAATGGASDPVVAAPESTPPAHDAHVEVGAIRFSDGQIQTHESLAAARALLPPATLVL